MATNVYSSFDSIKSFDSVKTSESTLDGDHSFLGPYFQPSNNASRESLLSGSLQMPSDQAPQMSSKDSSSTMYQSIVGSRNNPPRLHSQYPMDSAESHVDFILVAVFDNDKGSMMEYQYPSSISSDEHMLAELMLPDQAHSRSQDWTIFYLHKDFAGEDGDEESQSRRQSRLRASHVGEEGKLRDAEADESAVEGPGLIYVLNLVNTKYDTSARRGAVCKAMAICTRHPFLHIYKPLLLLALDDYFKSPSLDTLAELYDSVNNMDLSLMPRLSLLERHILQGSTAKDMFLEKFEYMIRQQELDDASSSPPVRSDGAVTSQPRYTFPRDTHEFESRVVYKGISVPVKVPTARLPETVGDFSIIKLIQKFSDEHAKSPLPFSLHPHLTTGGPNTHPIVVLVNALLTQKRVVFLGHNKPSGDVADAVLASCALASGGLLRGFTRHAFPYTDLTKIDALLEVPGFVAGVTNPVFETNHQWWDLLCDLSTGRMKISSNIAQPISTDGIQSFQQQNPSVSTPSQMQALQTQDATGDAAFIDNVLRSITNHLGEGVIRSMWRDWIVKLVRIAAAFEESVYGASALYIGGEEADAGAFGVKGHGYVWSDDSVRVREMAANINRIEGWRNTRTYYSLIQDTALLYTSRPITSIDLHHHHDRLRTQKLGKDVAAAIYLAFDKAIRTPADICQLLTVTPESHGGLFHISLGLLHPRKDVRMSTVRLLERIQTHEAGRHFWNGLSRFTKMAFIRIQKEMRNAVNDDRLSKTTALFEPTGIPSA